MEDREEIAAGDGVVQQLASLNLRPHGLAGDLVVRFLEAAIEQALDAVFRIEGDAGRADERAEPSFQVRLLGQVPADQLVELSRFLFERPGGFD